MIRYWLSRAFTKHAERFVPGDRFFNATAKDLMETNRDYYRDELTNSLKILFEKFDAALHIESEATGNGRAVFKISSPRYPTNAPIEFSVSTECSDLLLSLGREAAFCIEKNGESKIFYYGNSINPDNDSQHLGMPRYFDQIKQIAQYFSRETFSALYAARPKTIDVTPA